MAHDARARGADWVIPLDVDEFWHPWEPLQGIVGEAAAKGLGALEVRRIEFIQARDQVETTMAGSRRATWRVERPLAGDAAMAEFMAGERSMFETEPQPKWIVRTTPDLRIAMGGHSAENTAGPTEVCLRISIFHLAMRSRKRAQDRVEHAVRVDLVDKRTNVSVQNRYWKMMAERGDLDGAWRAHSSEDGALDVFGRRVELIEDNTMADLLEPYTRSRLRQWVREKRRPRIGPV
jgi:hypothetical protein